MGLTPNDQEETSSSTPEHSADLSLAKLSAEADGVEVVAPEPVASVATSGVNSDQVVDLEAAVPVSAAVVQPSTDVVVAESLTPVSVSSGSPMSTPSQSLPYNQAPTNAQRPGERLRQARLYQQRELKEIASELNISERLLTAIEADEYKSLPEPAFIRGYLRSYARYLGIDSDILISQFNEIYTSATGLSSNHSLENSPLQQLAKLQSKTRKSSSWMLWIAIPIVVVLIVLAVRPLVKKVMSTSAVSTQSHSVVSNDSSVDNGPVASGNVLPSVTAAPLSTSTSTPPATNTMQPITMAAANDQLVLTLSKASKVNVQDSTGKTLVTGLQGTDQPLTLTGISPFSITLDDADSVGLSLNGEKVDLKPYTVQGKAAFRLSR